MRLTNLLPSSLARNTYREVVSTAHVRYLAGLRIVELNSEMQELEPYLSYPGNNVIQATCVSKNPDQDFAYHSMTTND